MGIEQNRPQNTAGFKPETQVVHVSSEVETLRLRMLEIKTLTINKLLHYLTFVSIGFSDRRKIDTDLRKQLLQERGFHCEACFQTFDSKDLEVHHTDYSTMNDPTSLRVVCKSCHQVITGLTDFVKGFAQHTGVANRNVQIQISQTPNPTRSERLPDNEIEKNPPDVPAYKTFFRKKTQ